MRVATYRCDYCKTLKGESNHWWMLSASHRYVLIPWDPELADRSGYEHICSASCASTAQSKWMAAAITPVPLPTDALERVAQEVVP